MHKMCLFIVLLFCSIFIYYFINPVDYFWMPKCPTKILLGINCPGCGLQRAVHAFLHGHIREAIKYNLFFVVVFPYLLAIILCSLLKEGELRQKIRIIVESKWMTHGYVLLFFLWFVVRNIIKI